jgi:hypothetical protein
MFIDYRIQKQRISHYTASHVCCCYTHTTLESESVP